MLRTILLGAAVAFGLPAASALAGPETDPAALAQPSAARMSAEAAYRGAMAGDLVLVDVRDPAMWAKDGVPEGAFTLDWHDPTFFDQIDLLADGDKSAAIALICNRGVRTATAAKALAERGYTRVFDVHEGLKGSSSGRGWIAAGLPMENY
jgi:rhodanese-related sulfurtransferase